MLDPITMSLYTTYEQAAVLRVRNRDRLVILSDLHVGNGGRGDDFRKNASLFFEILRRHYLPQGYSLILNGDIEELHRFSLQEIERGWPELYALYDAFDREGRLHKIIGNHDMVLPLYREYPYHDRLLQALKIRYRDDTLFVFHGHQASGFQTRFNVLVGLSLRYVARPLGIKSYSVSQNRLRQYRMERRVYAFSNANRIASVVGHTHRPLFESLSKVDYLRFKIEQLCREYTTSRARQRGKLSVDIQRYKAELERIGEKKGDNRSRRSIYNSRLLVPCLFNSGCGIGKRGITAIELADGEIALVHWFDSTRSRRHFDEQDPQRLEGTDYHRAVLNQDTLGYIFTRIRLLAD